ncbi:phosphatase PAP2 family protein [Candidatus Halobonum tyrrellensis]|uniref:PA-phosphatase like phosphoesterase n=1 Tax=Candidatus Halobonum tyrrellensis G22 TaxID=1324957 RepID=V4HKV7_9EURY|nr:phosphatase PAP2 family protein [Candidatus Halobonum tyrrellensis]ESP88559.1 PA-phosphatase like phosphoesterase [Candidatus Halobonum tyrrellensis G22]
MNVDGRERWGWVAALVAVVFAAFAAWVSVSVGVVPSPSRGFGVSGLTSSEPVLVAMGALTQLGDPWFLLVVAMLVFLVGVERSVVESPAGGAFVLAATFAGFSFVDLLKHLFRYSRPAGATEATVPTWLPPVVDGAVRNTLVGDGFAFPSGHALGTTVVFGALAYTLNVGSERRRWAAAALGVALVSLSRVVIGVHFVVDVVGGILAGSALLGAAIWIGDHRPLRVFGLGTAVGAAALGATALPPAGALPPVGQWFGASLGGGVAWYLVRPSRELASKGALIVGLPTGALWVVTYFLTLSLPIVVAATALLGGLTVAAPTLVDRFGPADAG